MRMNRLLLLALLIAAPIAVHGSEPGPKNGFQDLQWGAPPTADMVPIGRDLRTWENSSSLKPMDLYGRQGRADVVGVRPRMILYYFYKNELCRVRVEWDKQTDDTFQRMIKDLRFAWGEEDSIENPADKFSNRLWFSAGQITVAVLSRGSDTATLHLFDDVCNRRASAEAAGL